MDLRRLLAAAALIVGSFASLAWAQHYFVKPSGFVASNGAALGTGLTSRVAVVCGNSTRIFDYILAATGEKKTHFVEVRARGTETGRVVFFYRDRSWLIIRDFFADRVEDDWACIEATGDAETLGGYLDETTPPPPRRPVIRNAPEA